MFLATVHPLERGDRVRVEVLDHEHGFAVEGVVARVHRVTPALRQVSQPGVGVRFLSIAELISELFLGVPVGQSGSTVNAAPSPDEEADELGEDAAEPASAREEAAPARSGSPSQGSGSVTLPPGSSVPSPPQRAAPSYTTPPMVGAMVFALRLTNSQEMVRVYDRDVRSGGLFIRTPNPAAIDDRITVELHLPPPSTGPLYFGARVVHCFNPPAPAGTGANLLAGMGVVFDDPPAVLAALKPHVDRIRGG